MHGRPRRSWRRDALRAIRFLAPHRGPVAAVIAVTLLVSGGHAFEPLVLKYILDALGRPEAWSLVVLGAAALVGLGLATELLSSWSNCMTWRIRLRVHQALLDATVAKIYRLPLSHHQRESVGGVMTRVERGINGIIGTASDVAFNVLPSAAYLAISVVLMVQLQWQLSLMVLLFTCVPALIGGWAAGKQTARERRVMHAWSRIYSRHYEVLSGIVTVKCFANEDRERACFIGAVARNNGTIERGVTFDTGVGAAKNVVTLAARVAVILAGAWLVLRGESSIGTVVAFLGYAGGIFGPVHGLTAAYESLRVGSVALEAVFSIHDVPDAVRDAPGAAAPARVRGEVTFRDVCFSYPGGSPVLSNVDLCVAPGEKVAIVGPSGVGKSTMMWLLLRFYDPTRGAVLLDGVDLRELRQDALRGHVGIVFQDTVLFNDTICANIAYGRPDARREDVVAAAVAANAHDFISRLPDGYATVIGERGCTLSAGERQRIAIARAVVRDPRVLILDEATSNLDHASEAAVRESLRRVSRGRTTFIIGHRTSMAAEADRIVVLTSGRIVEVGTHGELASTGGYYAAMVESELRRLQGGHRVSPRPERQAAPA